MFNENSLAEISRLMNDSLTNKVALFNVEASKYTDQAVREAFYEILGSDKLTWQGFRNHNTEIYTIIENVLSTNLPLAWENSSFYDEFVEVKNAALGDKNEFVVEDNSVLVASSFSGNTWHTDRQKLQGKKSFSVQPSWIVVNVYDDLERFLKGTVTLAEMVAKLQKAMQNEIDGRIYASFNGIGTYLPAAFKESGSYDEDTMISLIEKVQVASQKEVVVAATRTGLSHITKGMNTAFISDRAKEEKSSTGIVIDNIGLPARAIQIPQTFIRGTYDFKVNNNAIYVLPAESRLIKMFTEGEVRAKQMTEQDNYDQSVSAQTQIKVGVGIVCDNLCGVYTVS